MSENRSRYSSAPLQDMRRRPPKQAPAKAPASQQLPAGTSPNSYIILQVMLVAVLPLTFFVALLMKDTRIYWGFAIISLLCIGVMYLLKAFVPNARRVLGVVHTAMIAVVLFAILVSGPPQADPRIQTPQDLQSIFSEDTTASLAAMNENQVNTQAEATSNPGSASLAQQKLEQFMAAWGNKDYTAMVSYSAPNWVNQFETQRDAETSIFHLSAIRTPVSYQITDVSGNDSDQTRTITMQALISKSDGKEPQLYNFQILMIRSNNEWFVDPNSISSSQIIEQMTAIQQTIDQTTSLESDISQVSSNVAVITPTISSVRSDTVLYYNQDGGEYYHIDPNCSSIGEKYRPLTAMFYYRDVSSDTFKNLKTCPHCSAPARP